MKLKTIRLSLWAGLMLLGGAFPSFADETEAAREVINSFAGQQELPWKLELSIDASQKKHFKQRVEGDTLFISANSGVALCRGFYDFIKSQGWGIDSWSGRRFTPAALPEAHEKQLESPFEHHYYLNVVTYGYTMPYWDWKRWEREIEWMALHGIDMPLALVAQEAIMARVWKKMGLSDEQIANYFSGPAHLPWLRMGNLSSLDAPLTQDWHDGQVALQHQVLKKMRALGMKPICPGFAGFVPPVIKELYPDAEIVATSWAGAFHNSMLSPQSDLFVQMGEMFIREWEAEFGRNDYYLIDSFNEMEIPFPPKGTAERYELLNSYGKRVYESIYRANPDATWVMQGWMFGYQRAIWEPETLAALVQSVPQGKMLLLDLAADYNAHFWRNGFNWDFYKGFFGHDWIYSTIPNMGGKTGHTGVLDFYAKGHVSALQSENKGKLVGFGMAPEGTENNEVIYEMLADAGWAAEGLELKAWLAEYDANRYGKDLPELAEFWQLMQQSVYGSFTDHPRFNWQFRPGISSRGSIHFTPEYEQAIRLFASLSPHLGESELYRHDLAEYAAMYLGGKIEALTRRIAELEPQNALAEIARFEQLMLGMDALLSTHPTLRLEAWLEQPRALDAKAGAGNKYESNARRIVTIWGPPIDDYSARVWSGLIRDYYLPRWQLHFKNRAGEQHDIAAWEREWVVKTPALSPAPQGVDVLALVTELMALADAPLGAEHVIDETAILLDAANGAVQEFTLSMNELREKNSVLLRLPQHAAELKVKNARLRLDGRLYDIPYANGLLLKGGERKLVPLQIPADATGNNECKLMIEI